MVPFRPILERAQVQVCFIFVLFFTFTLAALQNVTVDDAVLAFPVVPQYLPNSSEWNIGGDCPGCLVQPERALAYNQTWHDTTFSAGSGILQTIGITFTGSALYVFFILANNVPGATINTSVSFVLDDVTVASYTHDATSSSDFEYNVPVFANDSLDYGAHNMVIQPVNSQQNTLMLFDYLIYTTNTSSSVSPSPTPSSTSGIPATRSLSKPNIGAIVGGTLGGLLAVLAVVCLLYFRRRSRYHAVQHSQEDGPVPPMAEPLILLREERPGLPSLVGHSIEQSFPRHLSSEPVSESTGKTGASVIMSPPQPPSLSVPSPVPPSSVASRTIATVDSSSVTASDGVSSRSRSTVQSGPGLHEQVAMLRNEVALLRHFHGQPVDSSFDAQSEAPPEYTPEMDR